MELIIGGAYQGKTEYARRKYGFTDEEIYTCSENEDIAFDRPCINRLEEFVLYCVKNRVSAKAVLDESYEKWQNSVIICREIFSGVVPIDDTVRAWREETGRTLTWLSSQADTVTRLFCGLDQRLK